MYIDRHIRVERVCEQCGNSFTARQSAVKRGKGRFCSLPCANVWQRKNSIRERGYENGKRYWGGEYWIVRWYDDSGGQHTTPYPRWWWIINVGKVPDGYYVSYKDENPENIDPSNFVCIPAKEVRTRNTKRHIGMSRSEESKKNMSESRIGIIFSDEHRKHLGDASRKSWANGVFNGVHVGENNHHWRGGHSKTYPKEFYEIRDFILSRDNYTCMICGKDVSNPRFGHVHHRDGIKEHNNPENLLSLCVHCHGKVHANNSTNDIIRSLRSELVWNQ